MATNIFIKLKPLQLFIYLFSIPTVMIIHALFFFSAEGQNYHIITQMTLLNIFMVVYGFWFFEVCGKMDMKSAGPGLSKFLGINFIILVTYTIIMNYLVYRHFLISPDELSATDIEFFNTLTPIMAVAQIYSTSLYLITIYLLSKSIIIREKGRFNGFRDTLGLMVLFIVSPIGIWFIQPRLQRLQAERKM